MSISLQDTVSPLTQGSINTFCMLQQQQSSNRFEDTCVTTLSLSLPLSAASLLQGASVGDAGKCDSPVQVWPTGFIYTFIVNPSGHLRSLLPRACWLLVLFTEYIMHHNTQSIHPYITHTADEPDFTLRCYTAYKYINKYIIYILHLDILSRVDILIKIEGRREGRN